MFAGLTCWTELLFSISNPCCRAYRLRGCGGDGWRRLRPGGVVDVEVVRSGKSPLLAKCARNGAHRRSIPATSRHAQLRRELPAEAAGAAKLQGSFDSAAASRSAKQRLR